MKYYKAIREKKNLEELVSGCFISSSWFAATPSPTWQEIA